MADVACITCGQTGEAITTPLFLGEPEAEIRGEQARFFTLSGLLTAEQREDWIEMDFPAEPEQPVDPPPALARALGVEPRYVGMNRFDYLVEVDSEEIVRGASPDFGLLNSLTERGVILTSRSTTGRYDFVSRFFAPAVGVNEDPVTGSAHCCLGPYWARRLGKQDFLAYQATPRGGVLRVAVKGKRVMSGGQAVTVLRGERDGRVRCLLARTPVLSQRACRASYPP